MFLRHNTLEVQPYILYQQYEETLAFYRLPLPAQYQAPEGNQTGKESERLTLADQALTFRNITLFESGDPTER